MGKTAILKRIARRAMGDEWRQEMERRREDAKLEAARDPFGRVKDKKKTKVALDRLAVGLRKSNDRLQKKQRLDRKEKRKQLKVENQLTLYASEEGVIMDYLLLAIYYWLDSFRNKSNPLNHGKKPPDPYRGI